MKLTMIKVRTEIRAMAKAAASIKGEKLQEYVEQTLTKESDRILSKAVKK